LQWSRFYLETSGINTLQAEVKLAPSGGFSSFSVLQSAPEGHPTLRPHHVEIALFNLNTEGSPVLSETILAQILPTPKTDLPQLEGKKADFVFLNYNDHAYAKILLDENSMKNLGNCLEKFQSPLLRQLLWGTLYHMVRDAKLKATEFLRLVREKLPFETDLKLVQSTIRSAEGCINFIPDALRLSECVQMFDFAWNRLHAAAPGDAQITWAKALITSAAEAEKVNKLLEFMDNSSVPGFSFDQAMRWSVIIKANAFGLPNAIQRLEEEEKRDASDRGERSACSARASFPTEDNKAKTYERIRNDKTSSYHLLSSVMSGFSWWHQRSLLLPYTDLYFDHLPLFYKERTKEIAGAYGHNLFPFEPENEKIFQKTEELLKKTNPEEDKVMIRLLKEYLDDLTRAKKCRNLILASKL